jgi:hypothetical protein
MRNLNNPGEVAVLLANVDAALAALQPKNYEDATWLVNNDGLRERFLARLRHPAHSEGLIANVGAQISAKCDAFIAANDKSLRWYPHDA